jgi:hypothetical protein
MRSTIYGIKLKPTLCLLESEMTAVIQKTEVKPTWTPEKMQEMYSRMMANSYMSAMQVICKHGEEATKEFQEISRKPMIAYYKKLNVTTPIEIIKAKAELESNIFGSKIEFWGDEKEAHLVYNSCGMWNAMKETGMPKEQEAKMCEGMEQCVSAFAHEFGLKSEVKFEGEKATITLRK